jgi:hypothetical protein
MMTSTKAVFAVFMNATTEASTAVMIDADRNQVRWTSKAAVDSALTTLENVIEAAVEEEDDKSPAPFHMGHTADVAWTIVFSVMITCAIVGNLAVFWIVLGELQHISKCVFCFVYAILHLSMYVCISVSHLKPEQARLNGQNYHNKVITKLL